ncbi:MAG: hypothetical protein FJZ08_00035 [Candidatus Omnitrophica bacterium]|nr:hypothetical protein [Candidatus Omnitrophota bacterium]
MRLKYMGWLWLILLFLAPAAYAQIESESYIRYLPERSAETISGKVGITQAESECAYEYKAFDKLPVKFSLGTQYIGIKNTTAVKLPARLIGLTTDVETTLPFFRFDKTYLRLGISPSFYADDWDFPASAFRIPLRSFLIYLPNPQWTFLAGLAVYPDFERKVLPLLGFIYKPNGKLSFNIIPKRPNINYSLNEKLALFIEGGAASSEFEVDKGDAKNTVLLYKENRLGLGAKFTPRPNIESCFSLGGVFNRTIKYKDSLGKVNIKDGMYIELRIGIKL